MYRHPTIVEVTHAFALEVGDDDVDAEALVAPKILLRSCVGLVSMSEDNSTLQLVHRSAYDFLSQHIDVMQAHGDLAATSLRYLCLKSLQAGRCQDIHDMDSRLRDLPFFYYAAKHWGAHVTDSCSEKQLKPLIEMLLEDANLRASSCQALHYRGGIKDEASAQAVFETTLYGQSSLHVAAYWGLPSTASRLLFANSKNIDFIDSHDWTPLHWSTSNGHDAVVKLCLDYVADTEATDFQGWTPLFWACYRGHIEIVRLLIDHGSDIEHVDEHGWTPLHWAASAGHRSIVGLLLDKAEEPVVRDSAAPDQDESSRFPYEHGTDLFYYYLPRNSEAPIQVAAQNGQSSVADLLLEARLGRRKGHERARGSYNYFWDSPCMSSINPPLTNMWRVLNKSDWLWSVRLSDKMYHVTQDAAVDAKGPMLAFAVKDRQLAIARLLLESGANANFLISPNRGDTSSQDWPLTHLAASQGDADIVALLLQYGAKASALDNKGQSLLHHAVLSGDSNTVKIALGWDLDVNARRGELLGNDLQSVIQSGQTPLMLACGIASRGRDVDMDRSAICRMLIDDGADVLAQDNTQQTVLHYACIGDCVDTVKEALSQGIDVNTCDVTGVTPLHLAAKSLDKPLIHYLIDSGADIFKKDHQGRYALQWIFESVNHESVGLQIEDLVGILAPHGNPAILDATYVTTDESWDSWDKTEHEFTVLSTAICMGNREVFALLRGRTNALPTDLNVVIRGALRNGNFEALKMILDRATCPLSVLGPLESHLRSYFREVDGPTDETREITQALEAAGYDLNAKFTEWSGDRHLLRSMTLEYVEASLVAFLLSCGVSPYVAIDGLDSCHMAAVYGRHDLLTLFLENTNLPPSGAGTQWLHYLYEHTPGVLQDLGQLAGAMKSSGELTRIQENVDAKKWTYVPVNPISELVLPESSLARLPG